MRVTVELVEDQRRRCTTDGCLHATVAAKIRGVQFVVAPIFFVAVRDGEGRVVFRVYACEDHLVRLGEEFALAIDTATGALLDFTPAERSPVPPER